jgi:glycerophosphoryl diester phosphodiesterase
LNRLTKGHAMAEIIAHRGASKESPENTLSAFRHAIELGADYIEIDVHLSKDEIPVVIHDAHLGRTTDHKSKGQVKEMTLEEMKTLDAGLWFSDAYAGEKIPTLEEVLLLNRKQTGLMIEIKKSHSSCKKIVKAVGDLVLSTQNNNLKEIIVGSFSLAILDEMREQYPSIPLIGIAEDFNRMVLLRERHFPRLALWHKLLNPSLIQALHEENTEVWAFTVDEIRVAKFLLSINIDGLITNDPAAIRSLMAVS